MNHIFSRTFRPGRGRSAGGTAVNLLVFVAGSAAIVGAVILLQKQGVFESLTGGPGEEGQPPAAARAAEKGEGDVILRADVKPERPRADNATVTAVSTPVGTAPERPKALSAVEGPAEPKFIGDVEYKRYHRPDCKLVKSLSAEKKVAFGSAAEAFAKGYIPCKVCAPEAPGAVAQETPPDEGVVVIAKDAPRPVSTELVGDADRTRYHRADCPRAKLIDARKKIRFASPADAFARGYAPCRSCNPDLPVLIARDLPPPPEKPHASRNLAENDKREMYKSLFALKGMLKGISTRERPYEVLSDRYRIPVAAVQAVEAEGNARAWPAE